MNRYEIILILLIAAVSFGGESNGNTGKQYGLISCGRPEITEALSKAGNGILKCTVNDKTHSADAGRLWGNGTWLNDNFFGTRGGLYIADQNQQDIFKREMEKVSKFFNATPANEQIGPFGVSSDGTDCSKNVIGMDYDRFLEFVLTSIRVYEFSGDMKFANQIYPHMLNVIDWIKMQDTDGDVLLEGRVMNEPVTGVGSGASGTYIGDTVRNNYKDFGASLFYYDALINLAKLEDVLGKKSAASSHRELASRVKNALSKIMWNQSNSGYLAWIEPNGVKQDYWVTGNNLHAVQCGLTNSKQTSMIIKKLNDNRDVLIDVVPCRTVLGVYAKDLCSNPENYYWNGGSWTLVSAPAMLAYRKTNDLNGAMHIMDVLANKVIMTENGYYESYWGYTGKENVCPGLLMNNGGVIWGFFAGVLGVDTSCDKLIISDTVPKDILPAEARIRYRGSDLEIKWSSGTKAKASLDGVSCKARNGQYEFKINHDVRMPVHSINIVVAEK